jgi:hypothetical protein
MNYHNAFNAEEKRELAKAAPAATADSTGDRFWEEFDRHLATRPSKKSAHPSAVTPRPTREN